MSLLSKLSPSKSSNKKYLPKVCISKLFWKPLLFFIWMTADFLDRERRKRSGFQNNLLMHTLGRYFLFELFEGDNFDRRDIILELLNQRVGFRGDIKRFMVATWIGQRRFDGVKPKENLFAHLASSTFIIFVVPGLPKGTPKVITIRAPFGASL